MGIPTLMAEGPTSGTYTAGPTANRIGVYMYAGGGGAGPAMCCMANRSGGNGGAGFYNKPITQPFSQPYSVGGGGTSNSGGPAGNAGGSTSIANVGTANGGGGGPGGPGNGSPGSQPGSNLTIANLYRPGGSGNAFSQQGVLSVGTGSNNPQQNGQAGLLVVFENSGT